MGFFPMFVDLKDKKCVVFGGGNVASRKVTQLLAFGAKICVISPQISETIRILEDKKRLFSYQRVYQEGDMQDAFLVVAATSSKDINRRIGKEARGQGAFVNIADDPEESTFLFPAIVQRGDLVVGVSTSGGAPLMAKTVKEKIENLLPESLSEVLSELKAFRQNVIITHMDMVEKKHLLESRMDALLDKERKRDEEEDSSWKS